MRMGFSLSDWVFYWMQAFGAVTQTNFGGVRLTESIVEKWLRTLDELEEKAEHRRAQNEIDGKTGNPAQDMLDTLQGPQLLKYASEAYWEMASRKQTDLTQLEWNQMSLSDRGKEIAYHRIRNSVEGMTRYAMELRANARRAKQKREADKRTPAKQRRRRRRRR